MIIKTNIQYMRDPFILKADRTYYAYGTGVVDDDWDDTKWICYKNTSGTLEGPWERLPQDIAVLPEWAIKNRWAPEVHEYKGSYYLLASYYSSVTEHKGTTVLKSASPEGPFVEISDGPVTPCEWDCIDGTLYVDEEGTPWMVYVYEWNNTPDGVGRMMASRMSADLTHFVSDPIELFKADEATWRDNDAVVTDGCYLYKAENGELLMLWSNFDPNGYCVGLARSSNGKIDGEWTHDQDLLFSKTLSGEYGGGHGMLFKDVDGKMYMSVHSPNSPQNGIGETTVFVPILEENGRLLPQF